MRNLFLLIRFIFYGFGLTGPALYAQAVFPSELVNFRAYPENPIFTGTNLETWDKQIRERGFILKEGPNYHVWITGYSPASPTQLLGLLQR